MITKNVFSISALIFLLCVSTFAPGSTGNTKREQKQTIKGTKRMKYSSTNVKNGVDWESFLAQHDPVWERLPEVWSEGAFIGNGRLGAMIYKGDNESEPGADVLAWTIGRSDVYDNRDPDYKKSEWSLVDHYRLPIGRFHILPVGKVEGGDIRIELWNGEASGTIRTDRGEVHWRSWIPDAAAEDGVVIIDVETDDGESGATWKWQPFRSMCPRMHARPVDGYEPNPDGHQEQVGDTKVWIQPLTVGGDYATAWKEITHSDTHRTLYVAVGYGIYTGGSADRAVAAVDTAANKNVDKLQQENRDWWHAYYPKSFVSIPDGQIESHYWIQMYKLAAATRKGGVIVDTCGPWLKVNTVWPAVWWNLNVQLFHYPIPVANHIDLSDPLFDLLKKELQNGNLIKNAPEEMQHNSAYFGNPTTTHELINRDVYWHGITQGDTVKRKGARLNHLPWICHTWWEHYRRTMDDTALRETLFPLTRRAYSFMFNFLEEGEDGRLHINDTYSSEYGAARDANECIAMIQWGCETLIWMCDRLQIDDPDISRWKDILARLVDPPVDELGLMIGSDVSFTVSHRHYSHMMSLVPFRTWDFEDPEARDLAFRSLKHFLRQRRGLTGYSYTGGSSIYAMLGDGDAALKTLQLYYHHFDRPSTMYTETDPTSPVMETPPSAARCVQDMLLQSHDVIRIFPAMPTNWHEAAFDKLLAEGAFEVSAVRKDGQTQFVRIRSLAGEPCYVKADLDDPMRLTDNGPVPVQVDERGVITLDLAKNEEVVLVTRAFTGELSIDPVKLDKSQCNYYGVKN